MGRKIWKRVLCRLLSPVVYTLEDESHEVESKEDDREDQLVVLQLDDVAVESEAEEHHVFRHDHEVDEELPHLR